MCQNDGSIECHSHDCGYNSYYFPKLLQGCVPIFREGMCCPADWVCPSIIEVSFDDNTPTEITTPNNIPSISSGGSVVCPPGINPNPNFVDYVIPPQDETLDDIATIGMGAPEYLSIAGKISNFFSFLTRNGLEFLVSREKSKCEKFATYTYYVTNNRIEFLRVQSSLKIFAQKYGRKGTDTYFIFQNK